MKILGKTIRFIIREESAASLFGEYPIDNRNGSYITINEMRKSKGLLPLGVKEYEVSVWKWLYKYLFRR